MRAIHFSRKNNQDISFLKGSAGLTRKVRDEVIEDRVVQTNARKRDDKDIKTEFTSQTVDNTGLS